MNRPAAPAESLRVIGQRRSIPRHAREIWSYRDLLSSLVGKELKVRYKNSALGFLWSMLQPLFLLGVYTFAFTVLGAGFARFSIWLLCGLVVWTFVTTAMTTSIQSVTANGYLVSKVRFPRAVLPLSTLGSAAAHFMLQLLALGLVLAVSRHNVEWGYFWLLPLALVATALFLGALGLILSAVNVYARDTQHLFEMMVTAWFWATPIVYPYHRAAAYLQRHDIPAGLLLINPATPVIITFQRALYGVTTVAAGGSTQQLLPLEGPMWYARNLLIICLAALALFTLALRIFDRLEANFAEAI